MTTRQPKPWSMVLLLCLLAAPAGGQEPKPAPSKLEEQLAEQQAQIAEEFRQFEEVMLRLAEWTAGADPDRAALLRKAVAESKDSLIVPQFQKIVELLKTDQLSLALSGQDQLQTDLKKLLDLLLSADADQANKSEQARIKEYLEHVKKLINKETSLRGQTSRSTQPADLSGRQGEIAEETRQLQEKIEKQEGGSTDQPQKAGDAEREPSAPSEGQPPAPGSPMPGGDPMQTPPGNEKPPESPPQGSSPPSESKPQPAQSQSPPNPSSQGQGQGGDSPPQDQPPQNQEQDSFQQRLKQAEQRMREAQEKLEQAKREEAVEKENEALKELEEAKAELERILRQLREEQLERMLAFLEERFRRMLEWQIEVYEGTLRLDQTPEPQRTRNDEIEAARLSRRESQIVVEVDKALALLREEGSAVAFPEAVDQMREDMLQVIVLLAAAKVGDETQLIEEDIIAALEEMIEALQNAQEDLQDEQPPQPPQPMDPDADQPLIDAIAELKMIRALQMRVNNRTEFYKKRFLAEDQEQVEAPEVLEALRKLAERQARIFQATRDIATGRNQ